METVTFKEVHAELVNESTFLQKNHDIRGFAEKANFLAQVGFTNSIATKLYGAIAENHGVIKEYEDKYRGRYKFILEPQLERVCEKYNLFVRNVDLFLGDIPEKNVRDIMGFKVFLDDILDLESQGRHIQEWIDARVRRGIIEIDPMRGIGNRPRYRVPINLIGEIHPKLRNIIQIAAVEALFDPKAFEETRARIINTPELEPKAQVDLDPIVLCKTLHGYVIITAWGDEANDELVVNANHN